MPLSAILPRKNCSSRGAIYWHRKTINLFGFVREARCQASLLAPEPRESHGRAGGRFLTLPDRRLQTARNLAGGPADYALTIAVKPVGRRHAVHSRSRKPAHHVRPEAFWVSLLPTRTSARGANLGAGQYTGMVGPGGAPGCREVYEKSHGNQQSRVV